MKTAGLGYLCVLLAHGSGCTSLLDVDGFDYGPPSSANTGGGGSGGMAVGGMAAGGSAVGGSGSAAGGMGGYGGSPPSLHDRGLLVRYYLDEADTGTGPTLLVDSHDPSTSLTIDYNFGAGGGGVGDMAFSEQAPGQRGLTWPTENVNGRSAAAASVGELVVLDGAQQITMECVARVEAGHSTGSRLFHLGANSAHGTVSFASRGPSNLQVRLNNITLEEWTLSDDLLQRSVVHYVLDTTLADDDDRARVYLNGVDLGPGDTQSAVPGLDESIALVDQTLVLGNRADGMRAIRGTIYYCALYGAALDPDEIAHNAALLAIRDDG